MAASSENTTTTTSSELQVSAAVTDAVLNSGEIVFYDLETDIPARDIIEFGAIVLDRQGLYEKESYSTLVHSKGVSKRSIDCNGITERMLENAPSFAQVADNIYRILHNRIWAGHNVIKFDNRMIDKEFAKLGRDPPKPVAVIDTLTLLRVTFGKRAGNLKLASLGAFFGLGTERHRAIEDVRMNIDVLKNAALTIFLEENCGLIVGAQPSPTSKTTTPAAAAAPQAKETVGSASVTVVGEGTTSVNWKNSEKEKQPERSPSGLKKEVIDALDIAIKTKSPVYITYEGGSNAGIPRCIVPHSWQHGQYLLRAECRQSRTVKSWTTRKILEVRDHDWEVPAPAEESEDESSQEPASQQS